MSKFYPLLTFFLFFSSVCSAADISERFSELFIENRGQVKDETGNTSDNVLFYSQGKFAQLFITTSGYSIVTNESDINKTTYHKIDFTFEKVSLHREQVAYIKGNYPALHFYRSANSLEDVSTTDLVIVRNIYPGIDWVWTFDKNKNPKHEFMVNIGADANVIKYSVSGATAKLSEGNNIIYSSEKVQVKEGPVTLQYHEKDFPGNINLNGNHISFEIPAGLNGGGFTIDPPIQLLWGAPLDTLRTSFKSITADDSLNTFTVGYSSDYAVPTFPQINGSYSVFPAKNTDLIIMKTDWNQNLVWATFFGGSDNDEANAVTVSPTGIFVTGYSESWDFPQATYGDYTHPVQLFGRDAFIAKFNGVGKWIWATGYGGVQPDEGMDIKYYDGKVFVAGYTKSTDFPILQKAGAYFYQDTLLTRNDAFLLEFDTLGNRIWASCFGGSGDDYFTSLAVDASGIYATGFSDSISGNSIPLQDPGGAYFQTTFQNTESFVTQFSPVGALEWSTYFGGGGNDYASCIIKNNCGIFICGTTDGAGLPVQSQLNGNYYQPNFGGGGSDGFIAKFDPTSFQELYCTYYGSSDTDVLTKIASDVNCNTIATGYTNANINLVGSPNYLFIQDSVAGGFDGLMLAMDNSQKIFWATTFGSEGNDFGYSVWFPNPYRVDMVGEGFYNYGKWRIGGTYLNEVCNDPEFCPQVTSNGVSNRFLQLDSVSWVPGTCPGGGSPGGGSGCSSNLQFQALIPMKNTCPDQCNGAARIDTANIGGCPPYQLIWNSGNLGLSDTSLCELYWSKVVDANGQTRVIYGRFNIFRVIGYEDGYTYCTTAMPNWDTLIFMTGGGPPYTIQYRGVSGGCPSTAYFDLSDTAGCIISYSLPWYRYNVGLELALHVNEDCKLTIQEIVPKGTCVSELEFVTVVVFDGTDTTRVPYGQLGQNGSTFTVQPGKYYSAYLDFPDCPIPVTGVYNLAPFQDTITKVLACSASDGSINVTIYADSGAIINSGYYDVYISIEGDSTGLIQYGNLYMNSFSSQTFTFNNLPADVYQIVIYGVNCDSTHASADLRTVYFRFNSPDTYCEETDTLTAIIDGGFPPFTYQWSPAAPNTASIAISNFGIYSLTITDNIGCVSSGSINVPGSTRLQITSLTENLDPCSSGLFSTAQVTATGGTLPYAYVWSSGESTSYANFLPQGNNWVRVYDFNHCEDVDSFQNTKQLQLNAIATVTDVSCFGLQNGSISLSISDGYPPYSVSWSNGSSGTPLNFLFAGDYGYTITDNQGCEFSGLITVLQPDSIIYFTFTADATCLAYNGYADITVNGGSGNISIEWFDADQNFTRFDLQTGTHTFSLIDTNGCSQTGSVDVGQYLPPIDDFISTTDATCFGYNDGSASIIVNTINTPVTFNWDNGATTPDVYNLYAGFHSVDIIDSIGCQYLEIVFIDEPDELFIYDLQSGDASCSAPDGYAYLGVSGGTQPYQVDWSDGGSGISRNNLSWGNHTFTITDVNNCELTGSVIIGQTNPITIDLTITNISCNGDSDGMASAIAINALTPVTFNWSTGSQLTFISNLPGGTYSLTVADNRGCVSIEQFQIIEPSQLIAYADTGNGILCSGGQTQVYIFGSGGTVPYNNNSYFLGAGTYTEILTDNNGCSASVTFTLTEPDPVVGTVSVTQPTCVSGGTVFVSASGGSGPYNIWYASVDQGNFTDTISLTPVVGFNTIQIFDVNGCQTDLTALVNTTGTPIGTAYASDPLCNGDSNGSVTIVMTQGVNPFTVHGISFTDSITIQNLAPGNYSDTITDAAGCVVVIDYILNNPDTLESAYQVLQNFLCSDDSVLVSFYANGGTPPYSGTGNFRFAAGSFTHSITDANGCSSDVSFTLVAPAPFFVDTSIIPATCNNNFSYVHVTASGGVGPYTINDGSNIISFTDTISFTLTAGSYNYTIQDSLDCVKNISFTLIAVNPVLGNIQTRNTNCNSDSSNSLIITMTQGAPPYLVNGFSFSDSIVFSNLVSGNYTYTVTDANNCSTVLSGTLTQSTVLVLDSIQILSEITCTGLTDAVIQVTVSGGTQNYTYILISPAGDTISQPGNVFTDLGPGMYTVIVIDALGCVVSSTVFINPYVPSNQRLDTDSVTCYGKNDGAIKIQSEPADRNPYTYSLNNGPFEGYNVFYTLEAGNYQLVVSDKFNCLDTLIVAITQPDSIDSRVWLNGELLPVDSLELDQQMFADFTKQNSHPWEINFLPDAQRLVDNESQIKIQPRDDMSYTVYIYRNALDRNCFVEYSGLILLMNVPGLPNIITPNGDGFNDIWEIDLDRFPHPEVTIFDRWGEIIFKSEDYLNDWNGLYRGKKVADGTYFYLLKVPSHSDKVYKGNINVLNSAK